MILAEDPILVFGVRGVRVLFTLLLLLLSRHQDTSDGCHQLIDISCLPVRECVRATREELWAACSTEVRTPLNTTQCHRHQSVSFSNSIHTLYTASMHTNCSCCQSVDVEIQLEMYSLISYLVMNV